ncbi:NDR1/HIN1-like protein 1 [Pistacia vera]|uniref:NDR1/HIN1-like protein 1 n=1 Tax=Pistacia vera TaxID=55513 RepID=UPI001262CD95|nr:NDR1/HIN1-like protein 1 [Pistacia vera]
MSAKGDCGHHGDGRRRLFRRIFAGILIFILIALITILLVWAILRPTKPKFVLQDATVYAFNVSSPNFLTSNFQVTISSRNPNDKVGVYYDKVDVYASYRNQQITYRTAIPPTYQGHNEIDVWSPFVYGTDVPVAPYNAVSLSQDQANGVIPLLFKIDGRVRWKVGTFISGKYHLYVKCSAYINFGSKQTGIPLGNNAVKYQLVQSCSVNV